MKVWFCWFLVFFSALTLGQKESPFNHLTPKLDSTGNYSFIVSGHFYGDGTNRSGYPANTLLANIDWINQQSDAVMLICLGDLFMDIKNEIPKYEKSLFDKLQIPLYNAVGNHDLTESIYQDNFGETFYYFTLGSDLHIVLDTERDNGDTQGEQLEFFEQLANDPKLNEYMNIFVYGHRTVWASSYAELEGLFSDNTQSLTETNFNSELLPVLEKIAAKSKLWWFAGSLGDAPASFFYFEDEKRQITYIATAIRAMLRDAVLLVHVNQGQTSFETVSFTEQPVENLQTYDYHYWQENSGEEPFNYRLIPLYIKSTFLSRYFWYGTAFALISSGTIWWFIRRRKRRMN